VNCTNVCRVPQEKTSPAERRLQGLSGNGEANSFQPESDVIGRNRASRHGNEIPDDFVERLQARESLSAIRRV